MARAAERYPGRAPMSSRSSQKPGQLFSTQLGYDIGRAAMDVLGDRGALAASETNPWGMFGHAYMWSLGILIAGGAANIQRNIIAERGLGMPRDPATKR